MDRLLLVRHAEATELGQGNPALDPRRQLTLAGKEQARWLGQALLNLGIRPSLVLTSPYTRCCETAEIVIQGWDNPPGIKELTELEPGCAWDSLLPLVTREMELCREGRGRNAKKGKEDVTVLVVGHQPDMGEMISAALTGQAREIPFEKGACFGLKWKKGIEKSPVAGWLSMDKETIEVVAQLKGGAKSRK